MNDVTPRTQWKYGRAFDINDIKRISETLCSISTGKNSEEIICNEYPANKLKMMRLSLSRDKEKNNHAVIQSRGFNCPFWYFVCMNYDLIPYNHGPRFNDYFCLFKDGDINNCRIDNLIPIKITKELSDKKKEISKYYIDNQIKGSIQATQSIFFTEALKTYNFPNAAIDSNLNDAWVQQSKGGKKPEPNFYHISNKKENK